MPFSERNRVVLAKRETTYAVDATPAGANAVLLSNLTITPQLAEFASRDLIRPFYGNSEELPTAISAQLEFEVEMAASGVAGTAPAWGPLLRACGFSETITAATKVEYVPVSSGFDSLSMVASVGGNGASRLAHKMLGCRGTVAFALSAKSIPKMKFRMQGLYSAVSDDSSALTPDFSAFMTPLPANGANTPTFTLHGVSAPMSDFGIDMANTLAFRSLIGGSESVLLTDRKPSGNATFEAVSVATKNWWDIARLGTTGALQLIHGAGAGKIIQIDAPAVQVKDPKYSDQNSVSMISVGLNLVPGASGSDEIKITVK